MHLIRTGAAVLAAFSLTAPAIAETIRCESVNGRERYCPGNTRGGVYLSNQLSREGCYQGNTWGYDRGGVWVSGGCRAEFQTSYGGSNWHGDNNYYSDRNNRSSNNDGAKAAIAIGAILGAAAIASAASKNRQSSSSDYQSNWNRGCEAAKQDQRRGMGRDYDRHDNSYDGRSQQAFSAGYNSCWSGR
jgi:hypothetical protein